MAAEDKPSEKVNTNKGKKRKYLPHGKPVKKGARPLRPGVQGFFITCDGGREHQATREALNLLDSFYEELVHVKDSGCEQRTIPSRPLNKIVKFKDSDSSSDEDEVPPDEGSNARNHEEEIELHGNKSTDGSKEDREKSDEHEDESKSQSKKQRLESEVRKSNIADSEEKGSDKAKERPIDELIDDELKELGDRSKRHFSSLDSGCNGVIFIQMHKKAGDPSPAKIVQHMMTSAASNRKHISRYILRVLPAEFACYASEDEIKKAIKPLIEEHFPTEAPLPKKFAVLYDARANTGIDRMGIINAIAKCVPQPHKVDLKHPDKTIVVQIVKTFCLVGVVERYKELSKYNIRQLTSPQNIAGHSAQQ